MSQQEAKEQPVNEELVLEYLSAVVDPDLHMDIVDLGLIYKVDVVACQESAKKDCLRVEVDMTLTTPACPIAPQIQAAAHARLLDIPQVEEAQVNLVFSPLWDPRVHPSEDARMQLGIF